ncbi:MAG: M42 family peptidase, partial [Clostridia bacterium]
MLELLENLCNAFGPSGCEDEVREIIIADIKNYATSYRIDAVGNLVVFKKGNKIPTKKMLFSAHMDEVGFMVSHISDDGFAYFDTVGGIDRRVVSGRRIVVGDNRVKAVVAAKPIHLQPFSERGVCVPIEKMYIEVGSTSKEQTKQVLCVGDLATF